METGGFVGARLKQVRNLKGVSQSGAAKHFGITKVGYQNYEAGRRFPSVEMLPKLAVYFNVSTDYLLGLSDEPHLPDKEIIELAKQLQAMRDKQEGKADDKG